MTLTADGRLMSGNCEINRQKLVEILSEKSLQELEIIRKTYTVVFGRDLLHVISFNQRSNPLRVSSETEKLRLVQHEVYEVIISATLKYVVDCKIKRVAYLRLNEAKARDAEILRSSLFGGSVNLNTVVEIICTRSSYELHCIREHYRSRYQSDAEKDVSMKISGSFSEVFHHNLIKSFLFWWITFFIPHACSSSRSWWQFASPVTAINTRRTRAWHCAMPRLSTRLSRAGKPSTGRRSAHS